MLELMRPKKSTEATPTRDKGKGRAPPPSPSQRPVVEIPSRTKRASEVERAPLKIRKYALRRPSPSEEPEYAPGSWQNPEPLVVRKRVVDSGPPGSWKRRGKSYARKSVGGRAPRTSQSGSSEESDKLDVEGTLGLDAVHEDEAPHRSPTPPRTPVAAPHKSPSPPPSATRRAGPSWATDNNTVTAVRGDKPATATTPTKATTSTPVKKGINGLRKTVTSAARSTGRNPPTTVPAKPVEHGSFEEEPIEQAAFENPAVEQETFEGQPVTEEPVAEQPVEQSPSPAHTKNVPEAASNVQSSRSTSPATKGQQKEGSQTGAQPAADAEADGLQEAGAGVNDVHATPPREQAEDAVKAGFSFVDAQASEPDPVSDVPPPSPPPAESAPEVPDSELPESETSESLEPQNAADVERDGSVGLVDDAIALEPSKPDSTHDEAIPSPKRSPKSAPPVDEDFTIDLTADSDREESVVPLDPQSDRDTTPLLRGKPVNKILDNARPTRKRTLILPSTRNQSSSRLGFEDDDFDLLPSADIDSDVDADPRLSRSEWQEALDVISTEVDHNKFTGRDMLTKSELEVPPDCVAPVRRHLDTTFIDKLHSFTETSNKPELQCAIFEAYIEMCTANDEPSAPPIKIRNDSGTGPPAFEFEYSNDMLYTSTVPDPEGSVGCSCEGPCDPNSKTCMCVARQELYFYGTQTGFAYNKYVTKTPASNPRDGTVKQSDCPIWECGPHCGCPPECMNRVSEELLTGVVDSYRLFSAVARRMSSWRSSRRGRRAGVSRPSHSFLKVDLLVSTPAS